MADDKKKDADGKADAAKKKKGLPALVLVAMGAALGGAGVVIAVPPKTVEVEVPAPVYADQPGQLDDLMEFQFNPRAQAGKSYASVSFYVVFVAREDRVEEAKEHCRREWKRAESRVLDLLSDMTLTELNGASGRRIVADAIVAELDRTFFPEHKGDKVARVEEVLWKKWIMQ